MAKRKTASRSALLILDMINDFDFPEAELILPSARKIAPKIAALKKKFGRRGWPVIYINDNFGQWKDDWKELFHRCIDDSCPGRAIAKCLEPNEKDYFILKPKHSAFYLTPLEVLLEELRIKKVVITGIAGNICVLFTAHDAHMRNLQVIVPKDCVASNTARDNEMALHQVKDVLGLATPLSTSI